MIIFTIIVSIADLFLRICLLCLAIVAYQFAVERVRALVKKIQRNRSYQLAVKRLHDIYYVLVKRIQQNPSYQLAVKRLHDKYHALVKSIERRLSFSTESLATRYDKETKTAVAQTAEMPGTFTMFGRLPLNALTLAAHEEESKQMLEEAINRPLPIGA